MMGPMHLSHTKVTKKKLFVFEMYIIKLELLCSKSIKNFITLV